MQHDQDFGGDDFEKDDSFEAINEQHVKDFFEIAQQEYELEDYKQDSYRRFVAECYDAGLSLRHYNGRFYFKGPAVVTSDISIVIRATTVEVQWDNMGLDWIVYPK
jgi:hypothetical protein